MEPTLDRDQPFFVKELVPGSDLRVNARGGGRTRRSGVRTGSWRSFSTATDARDDPVKRWR